ncbi:MAG: recombination regulator RecX [Candidatus Protistobacter heckmanni]|nr:recombination regulator RecX [Candidatus Protistobacter heckmanni]
MPGARPAFSLRGRALALLSRREQSRVELLRKLAPHAESAEEVEALLDALEKEGWLSGQRFAESVVHRKAGRYGAARILRELQTHKLDENVVESVRDALRGDEAERAREVWLKKFGEPPADAREHAKQMRFMLARGFSAEVCSRLIPPVRT